MTLKEKFEKNKMLTNGEIKIADDYAIEFGNWIGKNTISYHNGKFRINTLTPVFLTSEQLLEQFKKEKEL